MYDIQIKDLTKKLDDMEQKAEFGERSVEKLETTIDGLEANLYRLKIRYGLIFRVCKKIDDQLIFMARNSTKNIFRPIF